jgi:hypothetical protein
MIAPAHWKFFRAGGFDQVKLETAADLSNIEQLDQKLWVALACPTSGLEVDSRSLSMIDSDQDGRVRAPELIRAVQFACSYLRDPGALIKGEKHLPLKAINDDTDQGKVLLASAKQVLVNLGKANDKAISADDLTDPARIFANTPFNGDGIVTELSTEDPLLLCVMKEIVDCIGSGLDRAGVVGIDEPLVTAFFDELRAYAAWLDLAKADPEILPLDREKTAAAGAAVAAIGFKIDDYFARCRLAAFDPRLTDALNRKEEDYLQVVSHDLSASASELASFPLAQVGPGRSLPLLGTVNPAHAAALRALFDDAVVPLMGPKEDLKESDWAELSGRLSAYQNWIASKQGRRVEKLGEARILEILGSNAQAALMDLIAKDKALEAEATSIENVERLVRYYRDLFLICTNFINFQDFYDGNDPAVFQCGTLYLDQKECRLCLRVQDPSKHAIMAGLAGCYLAYADCARPATAEKMQIVAAITAGDSENLMVGRNGLFYDRQGRDWDATVTKIIDNPISIRQAFWSPYKKFVRMIEEHVAKRAAAADSQSNATLASTASSATNLDKAAATKEPKKIDVGSVAALGVAVGALGAFVTALIGYATGILKLGLLPTLAAIAGVILLISLPSVVLAYITLRKRNLGPILDANGWAINAHAKINVAFGATLTSTARLPKGARRDAHDRFADKGLPWKRFVFLLLLLVLGYRWYEGSLDRFLPAHIQSRQVLGRFAPEKPAPTQIVAPPTPSVTLAPH